MAKHTITHACGHTTTQQLYGKGADRERKISWWETVDCPDCYRAAQELARQKKREQETEKAAKYMEAAGQTLPELQGSEKQIAWALTIRAQKMEAEKEKIKKIIAGGTKKTEMTERYPEYAPALLAGIKTWWTETQANVSAKWWIDHREESMVYMLRAVVVEIGRPYTEAEKMRIEKEKEDHIKSVLSCLARVDWKKAITNDDPVTSDDGHAIEISICNCDLIALQKIDGKSQINYNGEFACWLDQRPEIKTLNNRLTAIYQDFGGWKWHCKKSAA